MAVRGDSGAAAHDGRCQEAGADGVGVGSSGVATMDGREDAQSATAGGRQRTTMHGAGGDLDTGEQEYYGQKPSLSEPAMMTLAGVAFPLGRF
uniref:Uncharacterized protein n=1 Tax=Oryza nivara TaxID=4536 RepID=A0A0E0HUE1_ORYNI